MMEPQPKSWRIALLIDADNAPAAKIDRILTELSTLGVINIRRAYGNWTKAGLNGWQERLLEFAIRPIQQFDYSKHKNASDMAMAVDALELLYTERPDAFGIVSSDADFTPLVMHLRAKGAAVYGFGEQKTPKPFVNACSRFLYLEALTNGESDASSVALDSSTEQGDITNINGEPPSSRLKNAGAVEQTGQREQVPTPQLRQDTALMNLLRDAVNAMQDETGWARVGAVGTQISNKASFDARNYGYRTLSKLLAATDAFEFKEEGTPGVSVRIRPRKSTSLQNNKKKIAAATDAPLEWPVQMGRVPFQPLLTPELHALRKVLIRLASRKATSAQILEAVPELCRGQACSLASVASRLREHHVLHPSRSALDVLSRHPEFEMQLATHPQTVRYLGLAHAERADRQ